MSSDDQNVNQILLGEASIFRNLSPDDINAMVASGQQRHTMPDEILIYEGGPSVDLLIVIAGKLRIDKSHSDGGRDHTVAYIGVGGVAGELGLLRQSPGIEPKANASVVTDEPTTVLQIPLKSIETCPELASVRENLIRNAGRVLADKLSTTNDAAVERLRAMLKRQQLFARYIVSIVGIFSLFSVSIYALVEMEQHLELTDLSTGSYRWMHAIVFTVLLFSGFFYCLRGSGLNLESLGCSSVLWRRDAVFGLFLSLPAITAMAIVRAILYPTETWYVPYVLTRQSTSDLSAELFALLLYLGPIVWMQEFITRVGIQAVIQDMLLEEPKKGAIISCVVAAVGFGAFHTYYGLLAVLVTTIAGLYWGVCFYFRRSLIMAGVMHMFSGFAAFYGFGLIRW